MSPAQESAIRMLRTFPKGIWYDNPYIRNTTLKALARKGLLVPTGKVLKAYGLELPLFKLAEVKP